jgi:hypothetical protein
MSNGARLPVYPEEVIEHTRQLRDSIARHRSGIDAGLAEGELAELYFSAQRAEEALADYLGASGYATVRPPIDPATPRPAREAIDRLFEAVAGRDPRIYPRPILCQDLAFVLRFFDDALADLSAPMSARPEAGSAVEQLLSAALQPPEGLALIPGGFSYRGKPYRLVGRPRAMLAALLKSRWHRLLASDLRKDLNVSDEKVEFPEQVIKDAASELRGALKEAVRAAGLQCKNPLPSVDEGEDLAYCLAMP